MTIKTLLQTSDINIETRRSDMQKRGAVRNLFNTTVDRDELQKQTAQLENESLQSLRNYKFHSIIGVIHSAKEDQARKLKRLPRCLESDDDSDEDEEPQRIVRTIRELPENDDDEEASSSSGDQDQPTRSSTSKKSSDLKLIASSKLPLPKGQKTLKGENRNSKTSPNNTNYHSLFPRF
jgi:hypothetical protein